MKILTHINGLVLEHGIKRETIKSFTLFMVGVKIIPSIGENFSEQFISLHGTCYFYVGSFISRTGTLQNRHVSLPGICCLSFFLKHIISIHLLPITSYYTSLLHQLFFFPTKTLKLSQKKR